MRVIVTGTDALAAPLVAVITALPVATALTTPLVTVATDPFELLHVTLAPLIAVPPASFTRAVSVSVAPTDEKDSVARLISNVAATWFTVTDTAALAAPLDAHTVVSPCEAAEIVPADDTVATATFELVHTTEAPLTARPDWSFAIAVTEDVCPMVVRPTVVTEREIEVTTGVVGAVGAVAP